MAVQMAGSIAIKRRAQGGAPGSPSALRSGELAHNEADNTLYIGAGDDGQGNATSIIAIAGVGTFATRQFVTDQMLNAGAGDMLLSVFDADDDGIIDLAARANKVGWDGVEDKPAAFPPATHSHSDATQTTSGFMTGAEKKKIAEIAAGANNYTHPATDGNRHVPVTSTADVAKFLKSSTTAGGPAIWSTISKTDVGLSNVENTAVKDMGISDATQVALDLKAPLASPIFIGTPTAPTAPQSTSNTQLATTAYVKAAISALVAGSGEALDTLKELADALGNDPDFAVTITNIAGSKLAKSANLSDLSDAAAARTNLELNSMALQSSNDVNITGGSITGIAIDGGTF